ncbi:hypothetical protein, partial [Olivibacter sp. XZL3]|uniref:hypothetical protein n=1 Tax=Olivibacter sp. XZL3 TaxID=1735116 RepID=UPI00197D7E73
RIWALNAINTPKSNSILRGQYAPVYPVNGVYLKFGKGRIVIFGDGAPFSAQLQGVKSEKRGMNHPGATQNAQFLFNIIHWLDRKL